MINLYFSPTVERGAYFHEGASVLPYGIFQNIFTSGFGGKHDWFTQSSTPETLYHRDDALLYSVYVMLIWAVPIPADRWHCSLWP